MKSQFLTPLCVQLASDGPKDDWILIAPLVYYSEIGGLITVPVGFQTDFCSVPRLPIVYDLVGNIARRCGTLHDHLYEQRMWGDREKCDRILREAMEAEGHSHLEAEAFYLAVQAGGRAYWDGHAEAAAA